jgi:hypothetical protein
VLIRIRYTDRSRWEGRPSELGKAPEKTVAWIEVHRRPDELRTLPTRFSGEDHYGFTALPYGDILFVGVWKDEDSADRDGTPDPWRGTGAWYRLTADSYAASDCRIPAEWLSNTYEHVWRGAWMPDADACAEGIL